MKKHVLVSHWAKFRVQNMQNWSNGRNFKIVGKLKNLINGHVSGNCDNFGGNFKCLLYNIIYREDDEDNVSSSSTFFIVLTLDLLAFSLLYRTNGQVIIYYFHFLFLVYDRIWCVKITAAGRKSTLKSKVIQVIT